MEKISEEKVYFCWTIMYRFILLYIWHYGCMRQVGSNWIKNGDKSLILILLPMCCLFCDQRMTDSWICLLKAKFIFNRMRAWTEFCNKNYKTVQFNKIATLKLCISRKAVHPKYLSQEQNEIVKSSLPSWLLRRFKLQSVTKCLRSKDLVSLARRSARRVSLSWGRR